MNAKFASIFVTVFIIGGSMGFSIAHESAPQSPTLSVPAAADLPRPGSPELHDLVTQPRYPLVAQPASS